MPYYEKLLEYIKSGVDNMIVSMLAIMYYIIGYITSENLDDIISRVDSSYDSSTDILTYNGNEYTINDLINYSIINIYKSDFNVSYDLLFWAIRDSLIKEKITELQATTLLETLSNA